MWRNLFLFFSIILFATACGGSDGSVSPTTQPPNPQLVVLNYPADFPVTIALPDQLKGISVVGIPAQLAYQFSYTATSTDVALLMLNTTNSSFICDSFTLVNNENVCVGTVLGDSMLINASNFSGASQSIVFNIEASNTSAFINQGNQQTPINIDSNTATSYNGVVAANGTSYYQFANLIQGSRYELEISNASNDVDIKLYKDLFITDAQCDPNYLTGTSCVFVSDNNSIALKVDGTFAFAGASFDITLTLLSNADMFEGVWYNPQTYDVSSTNLPRIGIVDDYNSYYKLTNLQSSRYYTVEYTGKTQPVTLQFFNSITGLAQAKACNPNIQRAGLTGDTSCTFLSGSSELYLIAKGNAISPATSEFIIKLTAGPLVQGSSATPINIMYASSVLRYQGMVNTASSYYKINGLTIGNSYLIRLSGNEKLSINLQMFDGDNSYTTPTSCDLTNQFGNQTYCIVTVTSNEFFIKVNGSATPPGSLYTLNVTPLPTNETSNNVPVATLPLAGSVGEFTSNYLITGLAPNTLYIAELNDAIGILLLEAWDDSASVIACGFRTRTGSGCLLNSGPNGNINMRVSTGEQGSDNNEPGGFFNLSMLPARVLSSTYQSVDTPIAIPDNTPAGINSQIVVSSSVITNLSNITVELFIEHGYTQDVSVSLISPTGQAILLVAALQTSELTNVRFNDYASENVQYTSNRLYQQTFRAVEPMHVLNGSEANGIWTLNVSDGFNTNISTAFGGTLHVWGLSFE